MLVMTGLVVASHDFAGGRAMKAWMPAPSECSN
jgi:hypothetical protein